MTEPDRHGVAEEFGTIEVFGIPFSTFTRSVVMGLEEYGLAQHYIQHHTKPHAGEVVQRNPFGLLPVLVHRAEGLYTSNEDATILFESNAIRRYIDEWLGPLANKKFRTNILLGGPTPLVGDYSSAAAHAARERAKVDQWISIASSLLFPAVELGVVKPRLAMEGNGADDESVHVGLQDGLARLDDRLAIIEQLMQKQGGGGDYLCGSDVTWADLFVYPPLADLRATREGEVVRGADARFPRLAAWLDRMDARPSARSTYEGTLASQRNGKAAAK